MNINFIIPDFVNMAESIYLLDAFKHHSEILEENIRISGLSGKFNGCCWNNKNKSDIYKLEVETLKQMKQKYNDEYKISLFIFFDKDEVSNKDLDNEYCNELIKIFDNKNNYVICKCSKLSNHIKEICQNINVLSDTIDSLYRIKLISEINLKELNLEERKKIIVIADGGFIPNKKFMFKHQKNFFDLTNFNPKKDNYYSKNNLSFFEMKKDKNYLDKESIVSCVREGVDTFILSGFGMYNFGMLENVIDFIIKEDYKMDQRISLANFIFREAEIECNEIFNFRL